MHDGRPAWDRLLNLLPVLKAQFAEAVPERPFAYIPRLAFRSAAISGKRWALLPSSAGFADPLLSTGFTLTLLGVARLAKLIEENWETVDFDKGVRKYSAQTDAELLATARLVAALYETMGNFPLFTAFSLLYFAAVSFSESACRLGQGILARSFLLHDHPVFGPRCLRLFEEAPRARTPRESAILCESILKTIEPFNVAGLGDHRRRNWYGVDADDLFNNASKLGVNREDISRMLHRAGFWR